MLILNRYITAFQLIRTDQPLFSSVQEGTKNKNALSLLQLSSLVFESIGINYKYEPSTGWYCETVKPLVLSTVLPDSARETTPSPAHKLHEWQSRALRASLTKEKTRLRGNSRPTNQEQITAFMRNIYAATATIFCRNKSMFPQEGKGLFAWRSVSWPRSWVS